MTNAMPRFIFTVSTGRSGQASLTAFFERFVPNCLTLFEEPQVRPILPGAIGDIERLFRRRFIETNELLGRGKVLTAFDSGDEKALARMAQNRVDWLLRQATRHQSDIVADISKHFIHGLHRHTLRIVDNVTIIRLIRDPILNMRSYLNRSKNFYLDNNRPDSPNNELVLSPSDLNPGELYLWAWCETYLRGDALVKEFGLSQMIEIRTEDMNDAAAMTRHFDTLNLSHHPVEIIPPKNTNIESGFRETTISEDDVETFERFMSRIPSRTLDRLSYLTGYLPRKHDQFSKQAS